MSEKASPKQVLDKKGKTSMSTVLDQTLIKEALLIRTVEDRLFDLFSQGKLNGTIHTCVGQEFIAVAFTQPLTSDDSIFSGHRCHGHFISFTKDFEGLLAELMGKTTGICAGIGGSQHLCKNNFYSNGVQGGIVPVSAGIALAQKLRQTKRRRKSRSMREKGVAIAFPSNSCVWPVPWIYPQLVSQRKDLFYNPLY